MLLISFQLSLYHSYRYDADLALPQGTFLAVFVLCLLFLSLDPGQ